MESDALRRKNLSVMTSILAVVAGMLMLSYAAVPLYDLFCRVTGYGGTPQLGAEPQGAILARKMTVGFNTDKAPALPWEFRALQRDVTIPIGKRTLVFFEATNRADHPVTATSTFNVTPFKAGQYFVKTQCFCYEEQILQPGQTATFPVSFYVDPTLDEDETLDEVKNITLSYTFFPVKP